MAMMKQKNEIILASLIAIKLISYNFLKLIKIFSKYFFGWIYYIFY